jgi:hypothetical protein
MGRGGQAFEALNALLRDGARIWSLAVPEDLAALDRITDRILAAVQR